MELTKTNENFNLTDTTEQGWTLNGNASKDTEGNIYINGIINSELGEPVGNIYYHKPAEGRMNLNLEVSEANRDVFSAYADSVIDFVLSQF